jgi:hypothetical protein
MDNIIAKEKLSDGPSNFKLWRDVVKNVFDKEDLYDLLEADDDSDDFSASEDSGVTNIMTRVVIVFRENHVRKTSSGYVRTNVCDGFPPADGHST